MINIKLKNILTFFLIITPIFATAFEATAPYAIILDYETGKFIYSKNGDSRMPPSSMSKLMSLYVIFNKLKSGEINLNDEVSISSKSWHAEGSRMFLEVGQKVKIMDLIRGIIVQSGNDACIALAEHISGSEEQFVELMNQEALQMGLKDSHFTNSTGLPAKEHFMTAHDLAILGARIISDFENFYKLFSEKDFTFNNIFQLNRNYELGLNGVDGIKTGHSNAIGYGIIISAKKDSKRLIAVVNGLPSEKERLNAAKILLNYGFDSFKRLNIADSKVPLTQIELYDNTKINAISLTDIKLILPNATNLNELKVLIQKPSHLSAPLQAFQKVANLEIYLNNELYESFDLVIETDVTKPNIITKLCNNVMYNLKNIFGKLLKN